MGITQGKNTLVKIYPCNVFLSNFTQSNLIMGITHGNVNKILCFVKFRCGFENLCYFVAFLFVVIYALLG